jgi:hypothetical protein
VNHVPTWIPAPPEESPPAMVNAVAEDMTIVKTTMDLSALGPKRGNIAITIHQVVLVWCCRRERFSRPLVHAAPDQKVARMFIREAVDRNPNKMELTLTWGGTG